MLLAGVYTTSTEYFVHITSNKTAQRWTLYSPVAIEDLENYKSGLPLKHPIITVSDISGVGVSAGSGKRYSEYVLVSLIMSHSGKVLHFYGNMVLLTPLIRELSNTGDMHEILKCLQGEDGTLVMKEYLLETGATVRFTYWNAFVKTAQKISTLEYIEAAKFVTPGLAETAKLIKLRTWEQIRAEKGDALRWLYDEYGQECKDYRLINTPELLDWVISEISQDKYQLLAWDTETTGLNLFCMRDMPDKRDKICGMSLTWKEDQAVYIPFMSEKFEVLPVKDTLDKLVPIMQTKVLGAHNGLFDMRVFKSLGYHVETKVDTMLMEFLFDPYVSKGSKGLKLVTRKYFGHETLELDDVLGGTVDATLIPYLDPDVIRIYGCADTDYVFKLIKLNLKRIKGDMQKPFLLDNAIAPILSNADYYGQRIDQKLLWTLSEINRKDLANLTAVMERYVRDIGTKTIARVKLEEFYLESGQKLPVSEEHIKLLCDDPEFREALEPMFCKDTKKMQPLEFSSPQDITKILYGILDYPVTKRDRDTDKPKADSEALENLMSYKAEVPVKFLSGDILSDIVNSDLKPSKKERVIIEKDKFEGMQYPFAYLLSEWRGLYKLRTSFFDMLLKNEQGEYYYTTNSMTSAETGRVINSIQTLIGQLKKLVIPYTDDYYMCVFDMSQIEYRVMIGLACNYWDAEINALKDEDQKLLLKSRDISHLAKRLANPESDYHREGGAIFIGTTPEDMTKQQRSSVKAIHFSVPYGAGVRSIAKNDLRKARTQQQAEDAITKTSTLLGAWQKNLYPLYYFLERKRDMALEPVPENELPVGKTGRWGRITNAMGRFRWFDLNDISGAGIASVRRMAGNYPIQSFAREIFFTIINRIHKRLVAEGFIDLNAEYPRVIMSAFIHDECVMHVHRSVNPYLLYKIIYEECMAVKFKGHPPYYMGLAIVDNWYEGKADKYEAPIEYVTQIIERMEKDPEFTKQEMWGIDARNYVYSGIKEYMDRRYWLEAQKYIQEDDAGVHVDMDSFMPVFKNYFLKPRLEAHYETHRKCKSEKEGPYDKLIALYEEPLVRYYKGKDIWIKYNGEVYRVQDKWNEGDLEKVLTPMSIREEPKKSEVMQSEETHVFSQQEDAFEGDAFTGSELGDVFAEDDFDESDMFEDSEDREEQVAREAMLLTESERSVFIDTEIREVEDVARERTVVKTRMYDLGRDRVVIDITGILKDKFMELRKYLMSNLDVIGRELWFMQGTQMTSTGKRLNYLVSRDEVDKILGV